MGLLSLRAIATLALIGSASAAPRNDAFAPRRRSRRRSPLLHKQLSVRGGAGPLDQTTVAKVATAAALVQGTLSTIAPDPSIKAYGNEPSPLSCHTMRRIGETLLSIGVSAYAIFFKDWGVNTAMGLANIIWILENISVLLNDEGSKLGYKKATSIIWLLLHSVMAFITFTNAGCATTAIKAFCIFTIVTCSPCVFFPKKAFEAESYDMSQVDTLSLALLEILGAWLTGLAIFFASLAYDVDPLKALGYAWFPGVFIGIKFLYFDDKAEQLGYPKAPSVMWLVFHVAVVASLAFD